MSVLPRFESIPYKDPYYSMTEVALAFNRRDESWATLGFFFSMSIEL
jgi:hypothetical protein